MAGGASGEVVQFPGQFFGGPGYQGEAVGVVVAARAESIGEGGQQRRVTVALFMFGHPCAQPGGSGLQGGLGPCGEDGWPCPVLGHGCGRCGCGDRWFGQDDVGIGAADVAVERDGQLRGGRLGDGCGDVVDAVTAGPAAALPQPAACPSWALAIPENVCVAANPPNGVPLPAAPALNENLLNGDAEAAAKAAAAVASQGKA